MLNMSLMSQPLNWLIILLMLVFGSILYQIVAENFNRSTTNE